MTHCFRLCGLGTVPPVIRLLSYNIHRCVGVDRRLSPERIAEVVAACDPDIVALQEVDVGRARSHGVDQAEAIARSLNMEPHFHPSLHVADERYGNAILTRDPASPVRAGLLPKRFAWPRQEARAAQWVAVQVAGVELQVINTHLGLRGAERLAQARDLLGPQWLGHPDCLDPAVLVGDLNAVPRSRAFRALAEGLDDTRRAARATRKQATFPSRLPLLRLDHIFTRGAVTVHSAASIRTRLTRVASDHLPYLVELSVRPIPDSATVASTTGHAPVAERTRAT